MAVEDLVHFLECSNVVRKAAALDLDVELSRQIIDDAHHFFAEQLVELFTLHVGEGTRESQ